MRFAIVTPTYAPDYERARLLVESVQRFAPDGVEHHLVVDRRDLPLFRSLQGPRTRLLEVESVLPWWLFRVPLVKKAWGSLRSLPVRNWILQQIVKLSVARHVETEALIFVDSDVTFVKPFTTGRFEREGRLRLSRVDFQSDEHRLWLQTARRLLRTTAEPPPVNFIGNLITWRRDVVLRLHGHLEQLHGTSWQQVVARTWDFSEYMLYGLYVEQVLGIEAAGHFADTRPVLRLSWGETLHTSADFDRFLGSVEPEHIGIMIHSKDGVPVASYEPAVRAYWSRA